MNVNYYLFPRESHCYPLQILFNIFENIWNILEILVEILNVFGISMVTARKPRNQKPKLNHFIT